MEQSKSKNNDITGSVTLVGFGPGNPDLLTIAGEKAIAGADIIFHDDLIDQEFLGKYKADKVYVGKRRHKHSANQEDINQLLLDAALAGKKVVRVKGGDPMVFAHGGEEIELLEKNNIPVTVIPGISTGLAVASLTKVPLTHRNVSSSVSFISGHAAEIGLPNTDTLVCYMAGFNIHRIAAKAIAEGRDPQTAVMLVSKVSTPEQQEFYSTFEELSKGPVNYPTPLIAVIGDVVKLKHHDSSTVEKPTYLVTGTDAHHYYSYGKIVHQPLIHLAALEDTTDLDTHVQDLHNYDWLIFTSRFAVKYFFESLHRIGKDTRFLCGVKVASLGKMTSNAMAEYGIIPDLASKDESSYGLIDAFNAYQSQGDSKSPRDSETKGKILIPRSEIALNVLPEGLTKQRWDVTPVAAYRNVFPDHLEPLDLSLMEGIIFSSPSCVDNFVRLYGALPKDKKLISRGKLTEERVQFYLK
ncbi:uroporphyrinogen-III C-methyltransferase [Parabacteroides sp. FAFU027]|uniref:uroporphyrinogen-III C-methyltransferase n=1 Tax=Parabacteroides sp. FAFU027 TaxID=2922715 RepID=UPI001FAEDD13|nr:uroporphyrinogen-III C-methyltransferase [Parabacteroides sp. FAFU027]